MASRKSVSPATKRAQSKSQLNVKGVQSITSMFAQREQKLKAASASKMNSGNSTCGSEIIQIQDSSSESEFSPESKKFKAMQCNKRKRKLSLDKDKVSLKSKQVKLIESRKSDTDSDSKLILSLECSSEKPLLADNKEDNCNNEPSEPARYTPCKQRELAPENKDGISPTKVSSFKTPNNHGKNCNKLNPVDSVSNIGCSHEKQSKTESVFGKVYGGRRFRRSNAKNKLLLSENLEKQDIKENGDRPSTSASDPIQFSDPNTNQDKNIITRESLSCNTEVSSHVSDSESTEAQEETEMKLEKLASLRENDGDPEGHVTIDRKPYYLENFCLILNSVLNDDDNKELFNEEDMQVINQFWALTEAGQKMYVRLFSRKLTWHPLAKLKYTEIADDLQPIVEKLVEAGLVITSDSGLTELQQTLNLLPAPDLKSLMKMYNIAGSGLQRAAMVDLLMKQSRQSTIGSFFLAKAPVKSAGTSVMLQRAHKLLGPCYRLCDSTRAVLVRALMLFSLINASPEDEENNNAQVPLYQLLLVNMGKLIYPKYTVIKQSRLFKSRSHLLRFASALELEAELVMCVEKREFSAAEALYLTAKRHLKELLTDQDTVDWDTSLPKFLRRYTAMEAYTCILHEGVEVLQRLRKYSEAVSQLRELIRSNYCMAYRGHWYDRLALNLDAHLKNSEETAECIISGMSDTSVRVGHQLSLCQRADKISKLVCKKTQKKLKKYAQMDVREAPKAVIDGTVLPKAIPGARFTFIIADGSGDPDNFVVCGVEQLVLDHYKYNGFSHGMHAEGALVTNLFCLYFWDIIFLDVPDAFHSPFQACPLDFHSDHFYTTREDAIVKRLAQIEQASDEELCSMMADTWTAQNGIRCNGMNWERFESLDQAQSLVRCMGGKVLVAIVGRYARDPRHTRSGFPDLTLWNPETKDFKLSEVKGPGDKLSHNQVLWLDYLLQNNIDAEVSHVKPVGSKKLTRKTSSELSTDT